jgi:hypothetical protein
MFGIPSSDTLLNSGSIRRHFGHQRAIQTHKSNNSEKKTKKITQKSFFQNHHLLSTKDHSQSYSTQNTTTNKIQNAFFSLAIEKVDPFVL